jgi:hypothetical protein
MARREPIASSLKLAFFVEGDADKDFVETLARRVLGPAAQVRVVRVGGKAAFSSTFSEAAQFLEAGYASVFLVVDADTEIPSEVDLQKQRLADVFRRYGLDDRVRIYMAVPMIEAWLLAGHRENPEQSTNPKQDLARITGGGNARDKIGTLAAQLPIDLARRRSRSFDEFVAGLETLLPSKAKRAS